MSYSYYPGCTLHEKAPGYDRSGRAAAEALGIEMTELTDWTCCGTAYPLTNRKIVGLVAPTRLMQKTLDEGNEKLITLCTFCFNVLKRTNYAIRTDETIRRRLNAYLEDEYERDGKEYTPYEGQVEVVHLLEVMRDDLGWDAVKGKVTKSLAGLKVAPYYGCLLLRPGKEVEFDDVENPTILEDMLTALGAEPVYFPHRTECCGSYLSLTAEQTAIEQSAEILKSASRFDADVMVLACPLCAYNLDNRQEDMLHKFLDHQPMPILYFTELLALALGVDEETCGFEHHCLDPRKILRDKALVS